MKLSFKVLAGNDNADLREVSNKVMEECFARNSADVEKFKAKFGDKMPCNPAPFLFTACSIGLIANVRFNFKA